MADQVPKVILGYSGLHGSAEFKAACFPGLDPREARLFQGLDSAAALVVDGELVAAVQQERYSGVKFDHAFPIEAIRSCLRIGGVNLAAVDAVAHNFDYARFAVFSRGDDLSRRRYEEVYAPGRQTELLHRFLPELAGHEVVQVPHHRAHALTAAIPSGFGEALVVVLDGMGELHAVSVYAWRHGTLERLACLDFRSSLGLFYGLVTMHLGYWPNSDEYKVMALAATGDRQRYRAALAEALVCGPDGRVEVPVLGWNRDARSRETFAGSRAWLGERVCPERRAGEPLTQAHHDFAAAAQYRLEEAINHLVGHWVRHTGLRRVAFAGGVALNCSAIGKLAGSDLVDAVFVQPAAGDEGTAVGAALSLAVPRASYPAMTYLGPDVSEDGPPAGQPHWSTRVEPGIGEVAVARLLAAGYIVGWAQGRLEFGPRALGNRSILADPRTRQARDRVNAAVKFREEFRPLAPAVKAESADRYFVLPPATDLRHMTVAVGVHGPKRAEIPAVVHDDGTARVQVVHRRDAPRFWRILDEFERLSGVPVLVNTSLNVKGQPTARAGAEAFHTFTTSELDAIVIGERLYAKPGVVTAAANAVAAAELAASHANHARSTPDYQLLGPAAARRSG
ncbi:carbamoyl transferase [Amycolatopsis mediterranei S699]|uniref:Carbamoyl transferase n=2 Tax=Amycolatopsis mediterranei TaxID=33910 RepID=A0A0H3D5Q4_AMYMU|nr:carbamoyltransferase C-terminal domain-containing protein [Amycolatopsis mediterranei]ADJ45418.1 carbamoyl transferase [Amycolatopsis mediterranei U32]AEK42183.1 carbamoyl transferase [Amycolatopsis mediterranei S699]AFO77130.1 carbamoyl transferase [Amycolatopsis mediterranei S699]AGT84258.1 carbamoyl transferase [Amycolatopsis mediterranei RB]KDO05997.1 carbamoyltransferase [Amycolatopsis mediterranei]